MSARFLPYCFVDPSGQGRKIADADGDTDHTNTIVNDAFSIVYEVSIYHAGAAHGTTSYLAYNYAMPSGTRVALGILSPLWKERVL